MWRFGGAPGTTTTVRSRTKAPLIDVGFTFKVEPAVQQTSNPADFEHCSRRKSTPSDDEDEIETIPRCTDPYVGNVDHLSRDTLNYCEMSLHVYIASPGSRDGIDSPKS